MGYNKLMSKTFEELGKRNTDLVHYVGNILSSQKKILDIIEESELFSKYYWKGVYTGNNSEVVFNEDEKEIYVEITKFGEPNKHQIINERNINDISYGLMGWQKKIDFIERMINERRIFEDVENIWGGFVKSIIYDSNADFNKECFDNATPYLNQHFEKLDDYIKKWDLYKGMFNRIKFGGKLIRRNSFDYVPGDRKPVKKSLIERIFNR